MRGRRLRERARRRHRCRGVGRRRRASARAAGARLERRDSITGADAGAVRRGGGGTATGATRLDRGTAAGVLSRIRRARDSARARSRCASHRCASPWRSRRPSGGVHRDGRSVAVAARALGALGARIAPRERQPEPELGAPLAVGAILTSMRPPCANAYSRAIASPRPEPLTRPSTGALPW